MSYLAVLLPNPNYFQGSWKRCSHVSCGGKMSLKLLTLKKSQHVHARSAQHFMTLWTPLVQPPPQKKKPKLRGWVVSKGALWKDSGMQHYSSSNIKYNVIKKAPSLTKATNTYTLTHSHVSICFVFTLTESDWKFVISHWHPGVSQPTAVNSPASQVALHVPVWESPHASTGQTEKWIGQ